MQGDWESPRFVPDCGLPRNHPAWHPSRWGWQQKQIRHQNPVQGTAESDGQSGPRRQGTSRLRLAKRIRCLSKALAYMGFAHNHHCHLPRTRNQPQQAGPCPRGMPQSVVIVKQIATTPADGQQIFSSQAKSRPKGYGKTRPRKGQWHRLARTWSHAER